MTLLEPEQYMEPVQFSISQCIIAEHNTQVNQENTTN